ncbi:MAG: ribosome-associated translation inhibitor RaiA [Bacilli bacterium]|nr:ribosome-associated translation inhibitor RaiA [Bacilli bacterium]
MMKCNIRGEKIKITDAIANYIDTKMARLDKYFKESDVKANIIVKLKNKKQAIEVTIPYDKYILRNEEVHDDLYAAIDLVIDKLERQIRKNKTKLKKHEKSNTMKFNFDYEVDKEEKNKSKIVKRKVIEMKPMSEEEAILELELLSHDFFIYKDMDGDTKVVYKRKDGHYGSIEIN